MPNGGSDCCGTCWFNAKNKGEAGYGHSRDPEPDHCSIRDLPIEDPFYTYCANHPHHRPERDPTPIGPVFTGDASGNRTLWRPSPDSEEIRQHLLALLEAMTEEPRTEYPMGLGTDEVVIIQLAEFREARARRALERIAAFDAQRGAPGPFRRTREATVRLAKDALEKIEGDRSDPSP
jgi:hypothetical protein